MKKERVSMKLAKISTMLFAVLVCQLSLGSDATEAGPTKVSKPLAYSGYSIAEYQGVAKSSEYVEMSDGERLALDIFLPTKGPTRNAFPIVFLYTPYQRATIDPESGKVNDYRDSGVPQFFCSYGYGLVFADMRGTGASTGWLMDFMPRICDDGKEIVDWMAKQPWCDGNVGMMGGSYLGWSQTATASRSPEALKCIVPTVIPLDGYTGEVYPGGVYLQGFLELWSEFMFTRQRNYHDPKLGAFPTVPVMDEDGDGELADEIPLDVDGSGTFLDDAPPPKYRDGKTRDDIYYELTSIHAKNNLDYAEWAKSQFFIDAKSPLGPTLYDLGPNAHVPGLIESKIPIYNIGGWFDGFTRGSFELFCTLQKTNASKILILPSYHGTASGPFFSYLNEDPAATKKNLLLEHLRFFDRYLKGIRNGIDTEPPICIHVMNGDGYRGEKEWPLSRQVMSKYFFSEGHQLLPKNGRGTTTYQADFSHSSTYGDNGGNRWLGIGGQAPSQLPIRTEKDRQCLTYTSLPMEIDTEVTGHPTVRFWVSSTADYGDFFVYLEDVNDKGEAVLVTEGQLRAGFAAIQDNDEIIASGAHGIDVLPDLPWHGYEKDQYVDRILADGKIVELVVSFHPTSWVFRTGHQLRVSIACADHPTFRLHPKLSPKNDSAANDNIIPTVTIHHDATYPSHVSLPIIPK